MSYRNTILLSLFFTVLYLKISDQADAVISAKDLKDLRGCWQGSLTYLDYSSNKPYTMNADLKVSRTGRSHTFILENIYPQEPKANSSDTIIISSDGRKINDEIVHSKLKNADGSLEIITEKEGLDGNDNKPATFRFTYTIGKKSYIHKKEVRFDGQQEWIKRHEYNYSRASCK